MPIKISMVYCIARKYNRTIDYKKAQRIAKKFSLFELERIFRKVGRV